MSETEYVARAKRLHDEVGELSSAYGSSFPLTSQQEIEYSSLLAHVRNENDSLCAALEQSISAELRERMERVRNITNLLSSFRCFAGSHEQKIKLREVWEGALQRGVENPQGLGPYDKPYTTVAQLNMLFPPSKRE